MQSNTDVALALSKFEPDQIPLVVFNQIARLTVIPVIEIILVSGEKILLLKRPDNDIYWAGKFHLPGKILSLSDAKSPDEYAQNIVAQLNPNIQGKLKFCGLKSYPTNRGAELAIIYMLRVNSFTNISHGYPTNINDLVSLNIIAEHKNIIESYATR